MYKMVLQIPASEEAFEPLSSLRWVGEEGAHGPHIKSQFGNDAETGEAVLFVRLKHHSWAQIEELLAKVKEVGPLE